MKVTCISNLGHSFGVRFQRLGELSDLNSAVAAHQEAIKLIPDDHATVIKLTPEGHANRAAYLSSLGASFLARFTRLGRLDDLDGAIHVQQQVDELIPDDHVSRAKHLNARFQRLGRLEDLDNAIRAQQQAIELTPEGHADKAAYLSSLGVSLLARFTRLGRLDDLDGAIRAQQQVIELTPQGHASKAACLGNLGDSFLARFERLGELADIDNVISAHQQAVVLTPEDGTYRAEYLSSLGCSFTVRFERFGNPADIDSGVAVLRQAVNLTPDGHAYQAFITTRFKRLGRLEDRQGIRLVPDDHAFKVGHLNELGISLRARFEVLGDLADIDGAITVQKQAVALTPTSHPYKALFSAARRWAQLVLSSKNPTISPLDTYKVELSSTTSAVNEAAAAAILADDLALVVEWLEEGRCIVWGQILQLRTPADELRVVNEELADELERVSHELESAGAVGGLDAHEDEKIISLEDEAQRHRRLAERYEEHVDETRKLPGFEGFLRPRRLASLLGAAATGPVVIINVDRQRCDALILRSSLDKILHSLHRSGVQECATCTKTAFSGNKASRVLAKLWSSVVHLVLFKLKLLDEQKRTQDMSHITWCATGPLAFLPLHAADIYDHPGGPKVFDYAVSAYTPTLAALLQADEHRHHTSIPSILVVSQPATPGQNPLPGMITEISAIEEHIGNLCFYRLNAEKATKDAVLKAMVEHSWIHLACHAVQHTGDPTKSASILHDGRLELMDIMRQSFKHTELAVLSACQTATGAEELPEEAVHLAAGMLMAGYRSVIATMWSIGDSDVPIVVKEFYSRLAKEASGGSGRNVAYVLHDAVKYLRDKIGESEFMRWVPFIHIGV
ncbi:CHAT domain-containing protein [Amylostereum chailletii]|nr:CHAT domain-containing protein [Amylostereum chailletii]